MVFSLLMFLQIGSGDQLFIQVMEQLFSGSQPVYDITNSTSDT